MSGTIIWREDRKTGRGELVLSLDDGTTRTLPHDEPITASTDAHDVASLFGRWSHVEHDRECIHVGE